MKQVNPCGHNDCFTCPYDECICTNTMIETMQEKQKRWTQNSNKAKKIRGEQWAAEGRCKRCGAVLPDDKYKTCEDCRIKSRAYLKKSRAKHPKQSHDDFVYNGLCYFCGKEPCEEGFKVCKKCHANTIRAKRIQTEQNGGRHIENGFSRGVDNYWKLTIAESEAHKKQRKNIEIRGSIHSGLGSE